MEVPERRDARLSRVYLDSRFAAKGFHEKVGFTLHDVHPLLDRRDLA
jgi:hypothetical protein